MLSAKAFPPDGTAPTTAVGRMSKSALPPAACPLLLSPQHTSALLSTSAHTCARPADMSTTFFPRSAPTAATGEEASRVLFAPSCPRWLRPQHFTPPVAWGLGLRVEGLECRGWGLGLRVQGVAPELRTAQQKSSPHVRSAWFGLGF